MTTRRGRARDQAHATSPWAADTVRSGRRVPLVLIVVLVVLSSVGGAAGAVLMLSGDEGADGETTSVVLEPVGMVQEDDFTGNLDVLGDALGAGVAIALGGLPEMQGKVSASELGLYGGSRDAQTCDVARLVGFLTDDANAGKARAWAGVEGIVTGEIAAFVDGLTPVRLRFDTRVTNHGYEADADKDPDDTGRLCKTLADSPTCAGSPGGGGNGGGDGSTDNFCADYAALVAPLADLSLNVDERVAIYDQLLALHPPEEIAADYETWLTGLRSAFTGGPAPDGPEWWDVVDRIGDYLGETCGLGGKGER